MAFQAEIDRHNRPATRAGSEDQLVDYALRLPDPAPGRIAVHIHLSHLSPASKRPEYLNVAIANFNAHARVFDGRTFLLSNRDIVFVAKDAQPRDIEHAVLKVRYLFPDDPLAQIQGVGDHAFATYFDLAEDMPLFVDHCERVRADAERDLARSAQAGSSLVRARDMRLANGASNDGSGRPSPSRKQPMSPETLVALEDQMRRADLSNALRRQPICAVARNGDLRPIYSELYFAIDELAAVMAPKHDLKSCRWLYRRLCEQLDARVLTAVLRHDDSTVRHHVALNLNVSTLLSQEFLAFDEAFPGTGRGSVLIELDFADVMADVRAFSFARDMLTSRGYRVCLDGIDHLSLPYIDRGRLGVDFVKFSADSNAIRMVRSGGLSVFSDNLRRNDPSRFIFVNCESSAAVALGQEYGVHLFQGRHIDGQLAAARISPRDMAARRAEEQRKAS